VPRKVKSDPPVDIWEPIAAALQNEIIFGRLQPREHLVEDELMARFDVSRYVARRALTELEAIGLVAREPNRGTRVKGYSAQEVEGLFEIRELLEKHAVRRMPLRNEPNLVAHLTEIQRRHEKVSKSGRLVDLFHVNNEFHEALYEACGNPLITQAIKTYAIQTAPIRMRLFPDEERRKQAVKDHWEMIDALRHDDRELLCALIGRHLTPTKKAYIQATSLVTHVDI
jgi:DNA-binding GntR family transcriptional regulator